MGACIRRRFAQSRLPTAAAATLALVSACTPTNVQPSPTPHVAEGGTLTLGIWQGPTSFLDAGIVAGLPSAGAVAAPAQEGLLWYRSAGDTQHAAGAADYWAPDLATEVPTLADGDVKTAGCADTAAAMCVTWRLRSGVRWHDGSDFTAHDVCDTFRLHWLDYGGAGKVNPTALANTAGWDQVIKCTEADRQTAVVDFKTQYGPYLSLGSGVFGILPATVLDLALTSGAGLDKSTQSVDLTTGSGNPAAFRGKGSLATVLDGTGPFVFSSYTPGSQVVLVRNPDYWDPTRRPHLDKLVFRIEPDLATEMEDVLSGAVGAGFDLRLGNLAALSGAAAHPSALIRVDAVRASGAEMLLFNMCAGGGATCANPAVEQSPYTADATVRRAILLGLDRQAMVGAVAAGLTSVPRDAWMYLGASYLDDPTLPTTGFDPQAANTLLDNAGDVRNQKCGAAPGGVAFRAARDGTCMVIDLGTTSDDPTRTRVESMVRSDLARIGINVPTPFTPNLPSAAFFDTLAGSGPLATHAFDALIYALGIGLPGEPDTYAASWHGDCGGTCPGESEVPSTANGGAGMNASGVSDPQLDSDLDKARGTADPGSRSTYYVEAEQRLAAILPAIPLYQQLVVDSYSTRLFGVKQNDLVWDFNIADWYCLAGQDGRGACSA